MRAPVGESVAETAASAVVCIMLCSSGGGVLECRDDGEVIGGISAVGAIRYRFGVQHAQRAAVENPVDAVARANPAEAVEGAFRAASHLRIPPRVAKVVQQQLMNFTAGGRVEVGGEDGRPRRRGCPDAVPDEPRRLPARLLFDGAIRKVRIEQRKAPEAL